MPSLIGNKRIEWTRYWVPWDGQVHSGWDGTGFLTDPSGLFGKSFNPQIRAIDAIIDRPFLVLTGQPGSGKTQAVAQLKLAWSNVSQDEQLLVRDARVLDTAAAVFLRTVDSPEWKVALESGKKLRLLIDSVDEAIMRRLDLISALREALEKQPLSQIRLILVSRAAEWDAEEGEKLAQLWGKTYKSCTNTKKNPSSKTEPDLENSIVWELCHLRQDDVEMAANACSVDAKLFLKHVRKLRVEALAARPVTLKMLLEEYKTDPQANSTFYQLYHKSLLQMCDEVNGERAKYVGPRPPKDQVYKTAQRIAACMLFGRKNIIVKDAQYREKSEAEILTESFLGREHQEDTDFDVTQELINFVLDTPLFSSRGPNYGYEQKTYAEFLAAEYVKNFSSEQLESLFVARIQDRKLIAPHLAEIAALVAVENTEWCQYITKNDPEVILRTDVSAISDDLKALTLASYLEKTTKEEAFDRQGLDKFYATFNHPKLANQLRPFIVNTRYNLVTRRVAIQIAGECHVSKLENELWKLAKRKDPCMRYIAAALEKISGLHSSERLLDVLKGKYPRENFRDLCAIALRLLVPNKLALSDVLPHLDIRRKRDSIDSYNYVCNHYLTEHIQKEDIADSLNWLAKKDYIFDGLHSINRFAIRVFEESLKYLDDPVINDSVVKLWLKCAENYQPLPKIEDDEGRAQQVKSIKGAAIARMFTESVIKSGRISKSNIHLIFNDLVGSDDLEWMLLKLESSEERHASLWAQLCAAYLNEERTKKYESILLRVYGNSPELRKALPPLEGRLNIVGSLSRIFRRQEALIAKRNRERSKNNKKRINRADAISKYLEHPASNRSEWVGLWPWFWEKELSDVQGVPHDTRTDLRLSPGWLASTQEVRDKTLECARAFLTHHKDSSREYGAQTNYSEAAYVAIVLLFREVLTNEALAKVIEKSWLGVIYNPWQRDKAQHPEMIKWAYERDPRSVLDSLINRIKKDNENGLADLALEDHSSCWDGKILSQVSELLFTDTFNARSTFRILSWIAKKDSASAIKLISDFLNRPSLTLTKRWEKALLLSSILVLSQSFWERVYPIIRNMSEEDAQNVFLELSYEFVHGDNPILSKLSDTQLADFGILIFKLFPEHLYPDYRPIGVVRSASNQDLIGDLRRYILDHLVGRGNLVAANAILTIAEASVPKQRIWLRWRYEEALRSLAASLVPSRKANEVIELAHSGDAVFIDSLDDLVVAILHSLDKLESQLRTKGIEWRALWNEESQSKRTKRSDPAKWTPKVEEAFSAVVADWLTRCFKATNRIVINREVEISKGNFSDIKVDSFVNGKSDIFTVIIECKRCIHPKVKSALKSQLIGQYLSPLKLTHGIYLIGWYRGYWQPTTKPAWKPKSLPDARIEATRWAKATVGLGFQVTSRVIDCTGNASIEH